MRRLLLGAVGCLALASAANAADMYVAPPLSGGYKDAPVPVATWTGFYAGINGGYGWGGDSQVACHGTNYCDRNSLGDDRTSFSSEGGFGGGQIGYNWQPLSGGGFKDGPVTGNFVFGIEADIQGSGIEGSGTISNTLGSATAKNALDWFGTVRGRLGYAWGSALLYGTAGFAFGGVQDKLNVGGTTVASDRTATGYAVGGGLEYAFTPAWSGKVEYQYINLDDDSLALNGVTADFNHEYNTVRVGLNYHFNRGYEPLK
ncbi:MAG: outer membrane beta-barrel protein [Rhodomicrobium sp.]